MRYFIGALLVASMLAPVAAQAQRDGFRGGADAEARAPGPRQGGRESRERGPRGDGPRYQPQPGGGPSNDGRQGFGDGTQRPGPTAGFERPQPVAPVAMDRGGNDRLQGNPGFDGRNDPRRGEDRRFDRQDDRGGIDRRDDRPRNAFEGRRPDWRNDRRGNDGRNWNDGRGYDDRGGWNRDRSNWDRGWRGQSRYDWTRYRDSNRGAFRLPRYYAPQGWDRGYRRFGVGISLSSALWSRNYWISDPYAYRLPEVYGPYRWVRYYDDALLVDLESGQVVDAVYGIFW